MKEKIAEPTIGRVVYLYDPKNMVPSRPMVAWVADVGNGFNENPLRINCGVMTNDGNFILGGAQNVKHVSEPRHTNELYWDWMDYQKGQTAKTEALQAELDKKVQGHDFGARSPGGPARAVQMNDMEHGKLQAGAPSVVDGKS